LHFLGKDIRFVNLQIIDTVAVAVRLRPSIDGFLQCKLGISFRAHIPAVSYTRSAELKTSDDTSVIADYQRNTVRTATRVWIPVEIAVLQSKTAAQDTSRLANNGFLVGLPARGSR